MRCFSLRVAVALFTFIVGLASASLWYRQRQSQSKRLESNVQQVIKGNDTSNVESTIQDCDPAFEGRYSNYDYAYSVQIPKGMIGFGSCVTNHGFGIDLTNPTSRLWTEQTREGSYPQSYLYVDASYNAGDWQSLEEAVKAHLAWLKDKGVTDIVLVSKTPTQLSKLRAIHFVARYNKFGEAMVRDMVLAFRGKRYEDILYTIDLTTPLSRYEKDRELLTEMQQTWRLQTLP